MTHFSQVIRTVVDLAKSMDKESRASINIPKVPFDKTEKNKIHIKI